MRSLAEPKGPCLSLVASSRARAKDESLPSLCPSHKDSAQDFLMPFFLVVSEDLKDLMRKAGDVTYADAHKDRRNEGVVEFASRRDMERAMEKFDDYDLNGRRIKIYEEKRKGKKS